MIYNNKCIYYFLDSSKNNDYQISLRPRKNHHQRKNLTLKSNHVQFAVNVCFTIRLTNTQGGSIKNGKIALLVKNTKLPDQPVLACDKHKINKQSNFESVLYSSAKDMTLINLKEHFGLLWEINDVNCAYHESYLKFTCHTSDQSFKRGANNMWVFHIENIAGFEHCNFSTDFQKFKVMRTIRDEIEKPLSIASKFDVDSFEVPKLLLNTEYAETYKKLLQDQKQKILLQSALHREAEEALLDRSLQTLANELFRLGVISSHELNH